MNINGLSSLRNDNPDTIIFQCLGGSHAYGTAHANSDEDIRGIFVLPALEYLTLHEPIENIADKRNDIVYYSLVKFMKLASVANPNTLELLYMPEDCIQVMTPFMQFILDNRECFITQRVYESHIGYAQAQLKKARGQNKWVNRPQPLETPQKLDYCYFFKDSHDTANYPGRSVPLTDSNIVPSQCHVASVEHAPNMFRVYSVGDDANGIFKNDAIVCHSITKEQEQNSFLGFLLFNKQGYEGAVRDYHHYWQWRKNRNEQRWVNQEQGQIDYDAKNIMHMFRLLLSCKHIFNHGTPQVRFAGKQLIFLKDILAGKYEFDDLMSKAHLEINELEKIKVSSDLPVEADSKIINDLLRSVTKQWEQSCEK